MGGGVLGSILCPECALVASTGLTGYSLGGDINTIATADRQYGAFMNTDGTATSYGEMAFNIAGKVGLLGLNFWGASILKNVTGTTFTTQNAQYPNGSFSIINWEGYPAGAIKPSGTFISIEGAEYNTARAVANQTNRILGNNNPWVRAEGLQFHEIQPVKFGGSPTDISNKMLVTQQEHIQYTNFWNNLQRNINNANK
jgi:hypothetical protein